MHYALVEPEHFTDAHRSFVMQFAHAVELVSSCNDAILGAKDVRSRHLTASDGYARVIGLSFGKEVTGRMDSDLPCEEFARFASCYVRQDLRLLARGHLDAIQSVLDIHACETGVKALVFDKCLLKHHPSKSVLGIVYAAYETNPERFTTVFPGYWEQFGFGCSIERVEQPMVDGLGRLSVVEHEVAFLLALGLDAEAIAHVLPRLRTGPGTDIDAALFGIADKAAAAGVPTTQLRDCLIGAFVHQRMPKSFFSKIVGTTN